MTYIDPPKPLSLVRLIISLKLLQIKNYREDTNRENSRGQMFNRERTRYNLMVGTWLWDVVSWKEISGGDTKPVRSL